MIYASANETKVYEEAVYVLRTKTTTYMLDFRTLATDTRYTADQVN